VKVDM